MKKYMNIAKLLSVIALVLTTITSCEKEPLVLTGANFEINTPEPYKAGEAINFTVTDKADFFTFFSGAKNEDYANYPKSKGTALTSNTFAYTYSAAGTYELTLIGSSFGQQATKSEFAVLKKTITVIDTRTGFSDFSILTPALKGAIDNTNGVVSFTIPANQSISAMTPLILTISKQAKVYLKNNLDTIVPGTSYDFTKDSIFTVVAPHGETKDFVVRFNRLPADTSRELLTFRASTLNKNAVIDQTTKRVDLELPLGTALTAVRVAGTSSGKSVIKIGTRTITSAGVTVNIATQPTIIAVIAESGDIQEYSLYTTLK